MTWCIGTVRQQSKKAAQKSAPNLLNMKAFSCAVDSYELSVGFFLSISFHTPHIGLVFGLCGSTCGLPYGAEKWSCIGRSPTWNTFLSCVFSHEPLVRFYLGIFFHTFHIAWVSYLQDYYPCELFCVPLNCCFWQISHGKCRIHIVFHLCVFSNVFSS